MSNCTELIGIDLFSGAGGLSLGAELAGVKVRYAIELDQWAVKTYRENHKEVQVIPKDITTLNPKEIIEDDNVFMILGGPPCQGFSLSNTRHRTMDNPMNMLFKEYVRFVREIKPIWFVFENVGGITKMEHGNVQKDIESRFEDEGYTIASKVLWASDYGVPQRRFRFFMVGNKNGIKFDFNSIEKQKEISVEEAIGDLPDLANGDKFESLPYKFNKKKASKYAQSMRKSSSMSTQNYVSRNNDLVIERYKHIGQGENWEAIPEELMTNYADKMRCHSGIYRRLIADKPSVVISNYRKSMLIHPYQHRGLSVREAARIQSFPDDYKFYGPISYIQQQIGNAVPPLLAKAVVEKILSYHS